MQKILRNKITGSTDTIKFYLNDDLIELKGIGARDTLLEYLRLERHLTGCKEGCGEGDCGACTVLIARLESDDLVYKTVNACICLLPSLNASHIVTIESLRRLDGTLHPVQKAMVEHHGSQCGFCTPGIVMSLYGAWLKSIEPTIFNIENSLQGNLCRCTGYGPIIEAAKSIGNYGSLSEDKLIQEKSSMQNNLTQLELRRSVMGNKEGSKFMLPKSVEDLSQMLLKNPEAIIVAGATDVGLWITKDLALLTPLIFVGNLKDLKKVLIHKERIEFGSCVTYSQAEKVFSEYLPATSAYFARIAGEQIRNVGTVGGNIGNGSPIGDLAPLFIALDATMILRRGNETREIAVENFFLDYNSQDIRKSEFIESIHVPIKENLSIFPYKVSKRRDEDISTIAAVFSFKIIDNKMLNVRAVYGGMAGVPRRALNLEETLEGKAFDNSIAKLAQLTLRTDFKPMSDLRASSEYRMEVAKNLIMKCQKEYIRQNHFEN